jgi:hypothetical protein
VGQYKVGRFAVVLALEKLRDRIVGEMAAPAHDPLFERPRVRADFEHLNVMVGLDNDPVASSQAFEDEIRKIPQVQRDTDLDPALFDDKSERIGRIMWHGKACERKSAHVEAFAGADSLVFPRIQYYSGTGEGRGGHEYGDIEAFRKGSDAAAVISMLVRNHDGRNAVRLDSALSQALCRFPAAQTDIHEDMGVSVTYQRGVSRASTAEQSKA